MLGVKESKGFTGDGSQSGLAADIAEPNLKASLQETERTR